MGQAPLRHQLFVLGAIVLFTLSFGACSLGIRWGGGQLQAMPACEQACRAIHAEAADIDIRIGKRDHSVCVCTNGVRLPSAEGDTVGALSFFVPAVTSILAGILVVVALSKRARARAAATGER
jgi:hypothetical protein